jgi:hypothetical protein
VILAGVLAPATLEAQTAEGCAAGQTPSLVFGFADLKTRLGEAMGDPLTCEFPDPNGTGDVHQRTTTGLAFWRKSTNTPTFTNGWDHWGLLQGQLVHWTGESIDPPAPSAYGDDTVWNYGEHDAALAAGCGVAFVGMLAPDIEPRDAACITAGMRAEGASESAVGFFSTTQQFLVSFTERGRVDTGVAAAPWVNMGRGETVFLNGSPEALLVTDVKLPDWQDDPAYAALLAELPNAFPFLEYARSSESTARPNGGQQFVLEYSMRECRACPEAGWMPVAYTFDGVGALANVEVRAPKRS